MKWIIHSVALAALLAISARANPDPWRVTVNAPHQARLVDDNAVALENILQMIGRARNSIDLEYFIFNPDHAGRLVLQALVKKAREGVKIRILVDYYSHAVEAGLDPYYCDQLAHYGIQVRYFNVAPLFEFWKVGFRNHQKFIVVDGSELLTGSRNIADEFFGMDEHVNYVGADIWIKGSVVRSAVENFDVFWNNHRVEKPAALQKPVFAQPSIASSSRADSTFAGGRDDCRAHLQEYNCRCKKVRESLQPGADDLELRRQIKELAEEKLHKSPVVDVHSITLISDTPTPGESKRIITPYLLKRLEQAKQSLLIENFLFLVKGREKQALLDLAQRGVRIDVLTNSFLSEPNFIMAELANSRQNMAVHHGINVFCYLSPPDSGRTFSGKSAVWGLHTKSMVIDGKDSMISSYNLDPRSAWINDEGAVFVNDSPEFARLLEERTRSRMKFATAMNHDGSYRNGYHCYSFGRMMTILFRPIAELFIDQL